MTQAPKKSSLRRFGSKALYILGVTLFLFIAGEITARLMGFQRFVENPQKIQIQPQGTFYAPDSILGYRGKPGLFKLLLNDSLTFEVTHDAAGWRLTSAVDTFTHRPEIWIFGCSFTHGFGVSDTQTYPWVLQELLPEYKVRNFGMDAYSTLQNWLTLRSLLDSGQKPAIVILAYGAFHDQRNTANRYWRKALHGQQIAEGIRYPFIRLDKNDSLVVHYERLEYHMLPLQHYFALPSLIEERWNHSEDEGLRSKYVTEILIQRMVNASHRAGAHFVLAGIYKHPDTQKILHTFHLEHLQTVDISQDLALQSLRIMPGNGHPNPLAHQKMAATLYQFLSKNVLTKKIPAIK